MLFTFTRILFVVTKHRILTWKSANIDMEILLVTKNKSQKSMYSVASFLLNIYFYV